MTAARGTAGNELGFAIEDDDKAASVGLEALDLLGEEVQAGWTCTVAERCMVLPRLCGGESR